MPVRREVRIVLAVGLSIASLALLVIACGTDGAPIAKAGDDRSVEVGTLVELAGDGSTDPQGASLTFAWAFERVPGGATAALSATTGPTTAFTPDVAGVYTVTLTVSNGVRSAVDRVDVTASTVIGEDGVTVMPIGDQTTRADEPIVVPVELVADDPDTIVLVGTSSDQTLVADGDVAPLGTGALRSLRITPAQQGAGTVGITVTATTPGGAQSSTTFDLVVTQPFMQVAKLVAPDGAAGDLFGDAVAIDGNVAVIGARGSDANGSASGTAYVYVRSGDTWNLNLQLPPSAPVVATNGGVSPSSVSTGDQFGFDVAVDGSFIVIGAPGDDDGGNSAGAAYVFERCPPFSSCLQPWSEVAKLVPDGAQAGDGFGWSVAIDGVHLIVGAPGTASASGAAYVFRRDGEAWVQIDELTASDTAPATYFGASVAIGGDRAVVGANVFGSGLDDFDGTAYVFERSGDLWNQVERLAENEAAPSNAFGRSVAISDDEIIVGDPLGFDDEAGAGRAYLFERVDGTWGRSRILASNDDAPGRRTDEGFGWSVDVSGDRFIVGAPRETDPNSLPGSVYVVERAGEVCCFTYHVKADAPNVGDRFGWSVGISGTFFLVGAPRDSEIATGAGAVYVFAR